MTPLLSAGLLATFLFCTDPPAASEHTIDALLLTPADYGANGLVNRDRFEQMGWNLTVVAASEPIAPCRAFAGPAGCPPIPADLLFEDLEGIGDYDCLVIWPGTQWTPNPYGDVLASPEALALVRAAMEAEVVVYTPCVGVRVLAAAGVLEGRSLCAHPKFVAEGAAAGATIIPGTPPPFVDGNLVSARRGLFNNVTICDRIASCVEETLGTCAREGRGEALVASTFVADGFATAGTIGGSATDVGHAVVATADGGVVIAGSTTSRGAGMSDALLVKLDADGEVVWTHTYGGAGAESAAAVITTADGGFAFVGFTTSEGAGKRDVMLVRTNAEGEEQWSRTFGGAGIDQGQALGATADGGFLLVGATGSIGAGEEDAWVIRTDAEGTEAWSRTYGDVGSELASGVAATDDGGFVFTGSTTSFGAGARDLYLVRIDGEGKETWSKTYGHGPRDYEWGNAIIALEDGGFAIAGNADRRDPNALDLMDAWLLRIDADGDKVWEARVGEGSFYDYGQGVIARADGSFTLVGATKLPATARNELLLVDVDADGRLLERRRIEGDGAEWGSGICSTPDGSCFVVGHTDSRGAGSLDLLFAKVAPSASDD